MNNLKKQVTGAGFILSLVLWSAPLAHAQFANPDLKSGKTVVRKLIILPPQAKSSNRG